MTAAGADAEPAEIEPGLWRWTARHPEWRPGAAAGSPADWPAEVGSVLVEVAGAAEPGGGGGCGAKRCSRSAAA